MRSAITTASTSFVRCSFTHNCSIMIFTNRDWEASTSVILSAAKDLITRHHKSFAPLRMTVPNVVVKIHHGEEKHVTED
jgi:hypothetical protein